MHPSPGTPVYVWVGPIRHLGIVSDRLWDGIPMVVSHSYRSGGTLEEPWSVFAGGGTVHPADLRTALAPWVVLARARAWIGRKTWGLLANCEHHVRFALGLKPTSPQLRGAVAALAGVAALLGSAGTSSTRRRSA